MTAIPRLTYQLGRSLYIPLTSRCNSIPLPITRGPGFVLSSDVVHVLRNVRWVENNNNAMMMMEGCGNTSSNGAAGGWIIADNGLGGDNKIIDGNNKVGLPEYNIPLVTTLYNNYNPPQEMKQNNDRQDDNNNHPTEMMATSNNTLEEDSIQPSIAMLVQQLLSHLNNVDLDLHEVCIAGEGEPTLRMDALLAVARTVQLYNQQQQQQQQHNDENLPRQISVRLITNGLCYTIPHLGYSIKNNNTNNNSNTPNNQNTIQLPKLRYKLLRDLIDAGVSRVSVALNTANRHEYDVLMQPACYTGGGMIMTDDNNNDGNDNHNASSSSSIQQQPIMTMMPGTAHDLICEFIMDATKLGMDVEITGVDRPGIDKVEMERLARLLLSVVPKPKKNHNNNKKKGMMRRRSGVRWRPYFE